VAASAPAPPSSQLLTSTGGQVRVVPKGIRSFDSSDADFFLELLPGPRDRAGLPDSIRFWKARIEERDPDQAFPVGLLYGPSGCGKSSLVKAGLLPRLAGHVIAVYVEATAGETEARLMKGLRKSCPELPADQGLVDSLAALRRGHGTPPGKKLLLVLDQFEQWLHARPALENAELIQALRQCDGGRVQCLVMVRDDFWMSATRFFREMEIRLVEAQNSAAVDLFDLRHARKVLALFGRAAGALPESATERTKEQNAFLDQAVAGLTQREKVVCVRLAVFAEMVKGKTWTPAILREIGGAAGVGITFLEETFSASTAPPEHRYHQKAARAVLKALLPESGSDIKGQMRSYDELWAASGYARDRRDFNDLLRILEVELRLITPTDPRGQPGDEDSRPEAESGRRYYQLTHDYLVHSLREWLTRKQKETWRGRAELRLEERTAQWLASQRQRRLLPSLWELLVFRTGVAPAKRNPVQEQFLRDATKRHALSWGLALTALLVTGVAIQQYLTSVSQESRAQRAESLVDLVVTASPGDVPNAIKNLDPYRDLARPMLETRFLAGPPGSSQQLHAAFALASLGEVKEEFLIRQVTLAPFPEARNLISALALAGQPARRMLRGMAEGEQDPDSRARYAISLLHLGDPDGAERVLSQLADPTGRTALIHSFPNWHGDLRVLPDLLKGLEQPAFRSGLCAALGLLPPSNLAIDERKELERILLDLYHSAPDGGTHSAAGWALRQWGVPVPGLKPSLQPEDGRRWFVSPLGLTMLEIPAGTFTMGSDSFATARPPHRVKLTQSYFVSDAEVPASLFKRFLDDQTDPDSRDARLRRAKQSARPQSGLQAAQKISWFEAVLFSNWLSRQEGRRPYYLRPADLREVVVRNKKVRLEIWGHDRQSDGYHLLTEAEWEYACRAGSTKSYCFGESPDRLVDYGVYIVNSESRAAQPRTKLPNAWGLFDMHGNVAEWCEDWFAEYDGEATDPQGPPLGTEKVYRGGGWFSNQAAMCGAAYRSNRLPDDAYYPIGIRVCLGGSRAP
jgi:formylglycine-generating enzyme required for sulfatase activity